MKYLLVCLISVVLMAQEPSQKELIENLITTARDYISKNATKEENNKWIKNWDKEVNESRTDGISENSLINDMFINWVRGRVDFIENWIVAYNKYKELIINKVENSEHVKDYYLSIMKENELSKPDKIKLCRYFLLYIDRELEFPKSVRELLVSKNVSDIIVMIKE